MLDHHASSVEIDIKNKQINKLINIKVQINQNLRFKNFIEIEEYLK